MSSRLRDTQRTAALRLLICLSIITSSYLMITTPSYAFNKQSLNLSNKAILPDGEPKNLDTAYDKWSRYDAKGWKYISAQTKNTLDEWNSFESPHGNYSSSSNKCRVCHALHQANKNSYRILFNDTRKTECDRCHDPVTGLSGKKPYRFFSTYHNSKGERTYSKTNSGQQPEKIRYLNGKKILLRDQDVKLINEAINDKKLLNTNSNDKNINMKDTVISLDSEFIPIMEAKGEHSIGATVIPDSNIERPSVFDADGLVCYACHDPHFSPLNTIQSIPRWKKRGLLKDPGENGGSAEDGMISVQPYDAKNKPTDQASANPSEAEIKSAFCADCHNKNPNWDNGDTSHDNRPNEYAHPIGNVDGKVDVYGQSKRVVNDFAVNQIKTKGCLGCHAATTETNENEEYVGLSNFPHQSRGHKLMFDDYTTLSDELTNGEFGGYTGDPNRPLPGLDVGMNSVDSGPGFMPGMCRRCHENVGQNSAEGF